MASEAGHAAGMASVSGRRGDVVDSSASCGGYIARTILPSPKVIAVLPAQARTGPSQDVWIVREDTVTLAQDMGTSLLEIHKQPSLGLVVEARTLAFRTRLPEYPMVTPNCDLLVLLSSMGTLTFVTVQAFGEGVDTDHGGGEHMVAIYRKPLIPEDPTVHTDVSQRCSHFDTDGKHLVVAAGRHRFSVHAVHGDSKDLVDDGVPITFHKAVSARGGAPEVVVDGIRLLEAGLLDAAHVGLAVLYTQTATKAPFVTIFEIESRSSYGRGASSVDALPVRSIRDPLNLAYASVIESSQVRVRLHPLNWIPGAFAVSVPEGLLIFGPGAYDTPVRVKVARQDKSPKQPATGSKLVATVAVDSARCELLVFMDTGDTYRVAVTPRFRSSVTHVGRLPRAKIATTLLSGTLHVVGDGMDGCLARWSHDNSELCEVANVQNWGPIRGVVVRPDSDCDTILACCGYEGTCTVRQIRESAEIDVLLRTDAVFGGVTGLWVVNSEGIQKRHVIVSSNDSTHALVSDAASADVVELEDASMSSGFDTTCETVHACSIGSNVIVQITRNMVRACRCIPQSAPTCTEWTSGTSRISLAASMPGFVAVVLPVDQLIVLLHWTMDSGLRQVACASVEEEVTCLALHSFPPLEGGVLCGCIIGSYNSNLVAFNFQSDGSSSALTTIHLTEFSEEKSAIAESILVDEGGDDSAILVGLRSGELVTFNADFFQNNATSSHPRAFTTKCGPSPLHLVACDGLHVGLMSRPVLIDRRSGRLRTSPLDFPKAAYCAFFDSDPAGLTLMYVANDALHFVSVEPDATLSTQTVFQSQDWSSHVINSVCHSLTHGALLLARPVDSGSASSYVALVDPSTSELVWQYDCAQTFIPTCATFLADEHDAFVVGASAADEAQDFSHALFLFQKSGSGFARSGQFLLDTAVAVVKPIQQSHVICGTGSKGIVLGCSLDGSSFHPVTEVNCLGAIKTIDVLDDRIAIGDRTNGVSLFTYRGSILNLVATDPITRMIVDVRIRADGTRILVWCLDEQGTLCSLLWPSGGPVRPALPLTSFSIGGGGLSVQSARLLNRGFDTAPQIVAFSTSGSATVLLRLSRELFPKLVALINAIDAQTPRLKCLLGNTHHAYRSQVQPMSGVIDGDYLCMFRTLPRTVQIEISSRAMFATVNDVLEMIELCT